MKKIAYGYLLVLELIPSVYWTGMFSYLLYIRVIGTFLLYLGIKEMSTKSHHFKEVTELSLLLTIVNFLLITVEIVNRSLLSSLLVTLLSGLIVLALFFITYKLYLGFQDIELRDGIRLHSDKLILALLYMAVLHIVSLIFVFEPMHSVITVGYILCKLFFIYRIFHVYTLVNQHQISEAIE